MFKTFWTTFKDIVLMESVYIDGLAKIHKKSLSDERLIEYSLRAYKSDNDFIYIPRQSLEDKYDCLNFIDNTVDGYRINMKFNDKRDDKERSLFQDNIVNEFMLELNRHGQRYPSKGGILVAPMGIGKTIIGCKIIEKINRNSIIIVPDNIILKQWSDTLKYFYNIDVGIVQGNKIDYKKQVVIAIQANIIQKNMSDSFYNSFGAVIYDECHRLSSIKNLESIIKFPAKYRIGLTATPRRHDKNWPEVEKHLGRILCEAHTKEKDNYTIIKDSLKNIFEFAPYKMDVSSLVYKPKVYLENTNIKKELDGSFIGAKIKLSRSKKRNNLIQNLAKKFRNRNVLIVTQFRKHAKLLQNRLGGSLFIGGMDINSLEKAKEDNLVIATYSKVKEGADLKKFDVLILAIPVKKDNEQICGRILRRMDGKKDITIIDLVDNEVLVNNKRIFKTFGQKRLKWYKSFDYTILSGE